MITISENTEVQLLDDLIKALELRSPEDCYMISFSKTAIPKDRWYPVILDSLHRTRRDEQATIYICHDGDAFLMAPNLSRRAFEIMVLDISGQLYATGLSNHAKAFSIQTNWLDLEIICQRKIKSVTYFKQEEAEKKLRRDDVESSVMELDEQLVHSIPQRRMQREGQHILIADDDQITRTLVSNILALDYNLHFAVNGKEAVHSYVTRAPDVVFLDIGLPDISGHDVLNYIFRFDPHAYVVMFSGRKDEANVMRAIDAGAKGYVIKPFTIEKLSGYIKKSPFIRNKVHAS